MLRCGHCEIICDNYESWLTHLVSEEHQANLGFSETFTNHSKDPDRNGRSLILLKMNPRTPPYDVLCHFAQAEPLAFITDAYIHMFQHVPERFYLIVFDQRKFADRFIQLQEDYGQQKVLSSMVHFDKKSSLTESQWASKMDSSFFYRRHAVLKRQLVEMNWDDQLSKLLKQASLNTAGYELREKVIDELETLVRETLENAEVHPFGSCTTWLADVNADLDIYLDVLGDGTSRSEQSRDEKMEGLDKVYKILKKKYDGKNVFAIRNARVPIIRLSHPSGLKVDISFENCLSVQNSKMIKFLSSFDYRIRPLLLFLRYWARFHNLVGPHSVKSYALILMALVYLKKQKLIPSVLDLQNVERTKQFSVCNWNAGYCHSRELTQQQYPNLKCIRESDRDGLGQEVMKLAYGFFCEYANLDYGSMVICPFLGEHIPKALFDSPYGQDLPVEMALYKANLYTGACTSFQTDRLLCIQDPFALNVNVTAPCSSQEILANLQAACASTADALKPYATNYDSSGTVSLLEVSCQHLKKNEEREPIKFQPSSIKQEVHDSVTVKTEDNQDSTWDSFLSTDLNQNEADNPFNMFTHIDTSPFKKRSRRNDKPIRIQRVNLYDETQVDLDTTPMDFVSEGDTPADDKKSLKSVVVVASMIKTEGSSSSSSQDGKKKKKNSKRKSVSPQPHFSQKDKNPEMVKSESLSTPLESKSSTKTVQPMTSPVVTFVGVPEVRQNPVVTFLPNNILSGTNFISFDQPLSSESSPTKILSAVSNGVSSNYGYERTVVIQPQMPQSTTKASKPNRSVYLPPALRNRMATEQQQASKAVVPTENIREEAGRGDKIQNPNDDNQESSIQRKESEALFPKFRVWMNEEFVDHFSSVVEPLVAAVGSEEIKLRRNIFWGNYIASLFADTFFWPKFMPLLHKFSIQKAENTDFIFRIVEMNKHNLEDDFLPFVNGKRPLVATSYESESESSDVDGDYHKVSKTLSNSDISHGRGGGRAAATPVSNETKGTLLKKLSKIPSNFRKKSGLMAFFECYPQQMVSLQMQWNKIANNLPVGQVPLDAFGKLCTQVTSAVVPQNEDRVDVQMLLALDSTAITPTLYCGFVSELPYDSPMIEAQTMVYDAIEGVIQDLIPLYLRHSVHKYFK